MKNHEGKIYMEILGDGLLPYDYVMPEDGLDSLKLSNQ